MTATCASIKKPKPDTTHLRSQSEGWPESPRGARRAPAAPDDIMVIVITGVGVRA